MRKKRDPRITESELWAALESAHGAPLGPRPKDSVTPQEYATRMGISYGRAAHVLRGDKRLKAVSFRTDSERQGICYVLNR